MNEPAEEGAGQPVSSSEAPREFCASCGEQLDPVTGACPRAGTSGHLGAEGLLWT